MILTHLIKETTKKDFCEYKNGVMSNIFGYSPTDKEKEKLDNFSLTRSQIPKKLSILNKTIKDLEKELEKNPSDYKSQKLNNFKENIIIVSQREDTKKSGYKLNKKINHFNYIFSDQLQPLYKQHPNYNDLPSSNPIYQKIKNLENKRLGIENDIKKLKLEKENKIRKFFETIFQEKLGLSYAVYITQEELIKNCQARGCDKINKCPHTSTNQSTTNQDLKNTTNRNEHQDLYSTAKKNK